MEKLIAELTEYFAHATPEVTAERIEYMAEQLDEHGLTLETATEDQLNNLQRGEDIDAWH